MRRSTYSYDLNDRLQSIQDHEGDTTAYTFNERNEVTSVTHDSRTVAYGYDLVGRRTSTDLPNGIRCAQAFDERNRLIFLNYQKGPNPILTYKYGHNQLGQRIVEENTSAEQCKLSRYCYNPRRELIQSDRRIGNGCNTVTHYRYDLNHNRIGQNQTTYTNNAADQLLDSQGPQGAGNIAYNAQGQAEFLGAGGLDLTYNQSQQIKTAHSGSVNARYFYDGSGRRVAKEVNGNREDYLLLGSEVLKTYENGALRAKYHLGLGREGIKTDDSWKYYLKDGLGSTVALTDDSGNSVAAWDYSDYGETTQIVGDSSVYNPFLYTGQEWDAELGMYNLRARHYSPSLGRFIARDPIGYGGGSNLYSYCNADPVNFVDPTGHAPVKIIQIFMNSLLLSQKAAWTQLAVDVAAEIGSGVVVKIFQGEASTQGQSGDVFSVDVVGEDKLDARYGVTPGKTFTLEAGFRSRIFLQSVQGVTKKAMFQNLDPGSMLSNLLLNVVKHELGHSLSHNIGEAMKGAGGVQDYSTMETNPMGWVSGVLPWDPARIRQIRKYLGLVCE